MNLPFKEKIRRADRDNTINVYISDEWEDVLQDGVWEQFFTELLIQLTSERDYMRYGKQSLAPFDLQAENIRKVISAMERD